MFWSIFSHSTPSLETNDNNKTSVFWLLGVAAIIFSIGYALKPVAEIVDELYDSDDSSDDEKDNKNT